MQKQPPFSEVSTPSATNLAFTLHEWLRILLPGFYFSALLFFFWLSYLSRFIPFDSPPAVWVILFVFVTLVAGLTMYAKESPKRRKAFVENQPSKYLLELSRTSRSAGPLTDDDARRLYFYILNTYMPVTFHEKVFFFGTVYHIMVLLRRTSFWFALLSLVALLLNLAEGIPLSGQQGLALYAIAVVFIYVLNVRHNKADRKMQENYQDQIFWLQMNHGLVADLLRSYRPALKQ